MTIVVAVLTAFLTVAVALSYAIRSYFLRTRLVMTLFFLFIVATLSVSFWDERHLTFPYSIPSFFFGLFLGHVLAVRVERQKLNAQGIDRYMKNFAHIHFRDFRQLNWWSLINFYSVMGALLMINLIGLSNVIFRGMNSLIILTSMVGALLIGTIIPYLTHLWTIDPMKIR